MGYIALVHKDEGTSYGVSFPDVPGCIAAGETFEDAAANAADALAAHFAVMKADGDAIRSRVPSKSSGKIRNLPTTALAPLSP
jgi:predicted RNase H-like HicB family nuclease